MLTTVVLISAEWDILDLLASLPRHQILGFIDKCPSLEMDGLAYLGNDNDWKDIKKKHPNIKAVLALDSPQAKARLFDHYGKEGIIKIISPQAYVSKKAFVGDGTIVQRGVTIMPKAHIGKGCKLNVNATIHHEAVVGDFCTLAPTALILGNVVLEEQVYVGAGAIIKQRCRVGKNSIVGAGAVVVKDVPPNVTVVGVPAKTHEKICHCISQ